MLPAELKIESLGLNFKAAYNLAYLPYQWHGYSFTPNPRTPFTSTIALSQLVTSDGIFSLLKCWHLAAAWGAPLPSSPRGTFAWDPPTLPQPRSWRVNAWQDGEHQTQHHCPAGLSPGWTAGEILCIHPVQTNGTRSALFPPSMLVLPLLLPVEILVIFQYPTQHTPPMHLTTIYWGSAMDIMVQDRCDWPLTEPVVQSWERNMHQITIQTNTSCMMWAMHGVW